MVKLNRKEKKQQREDQQAKSLYLQTIHPKTETQRKAFKGFQNGDHLVLHGLPGTGKTFIALYLSLSELQFGEYKQIMVVRSTVASRDQGFLPGNATEKARVYETPYMNLVQELYNRGDAYEILKSKNIVKFSTTAYIRGLTFDDSLIVIDEAQNMSPMELHTVLTRIGENSRLILCGDCGQDDLTNPRFREESGLHETMKVLKKMDNITFCEFNVDDIVRSGFVKDYIIARDNYDKQKRIQSQRPAYV